MSTSGLAAAILDFKLPVASLSIGDGASATGTDKGGHSFWNFTPILSRSRIISISGLSAAIFDSHFRLHRTVLTIVLPTWATLKRWI
jgi:hypothetical protein